MTIYDLQINHASNPISVDCDRPCFSWKLASNQKNTMQTAYRIQVLRESPREKTLVWDSGLVVSEQNLYIPYDGEALRPHTRYAVLLEAQSNGGSTATTEAFFETGLLTEAWQAKWIAAQAFETTPSYNPCVLFRKEITLPSQPVRARLYATALGVYAAYMNQASADDTFFNPGFTSYNKEQLYQVYDVTDKMQAGLNRLEFLLTEGWYSSDFTFDRIPNQYGDRNALLFELRLQYADGTEQLIVSDETAAWSLSPVLLSHIYDGEIYDARLESEEARAWAAVDTYAYKTNHLRGQSHEPVRWVEELTPLSLFVSPKGETILDLGQNMVGFVRIKLHTQNGGRIRLHYFETLDADGCAYFDNLKNAKQELIVTCGTGDLVFEPHFTYAGFRYVHIVEFPQEPALSHFTGVVLSSDLKRTGHFECSRPLINQLQSNITWSQKDNFVEIPTDCPQRCERLGWTADAQIFARTACFNQNCLQFFRKWLRSLHADQEPTGAVPFVIPNNLPADWGPLIEFPKQSSAVWGDAATITPWTLYDCYGDTSILAECYDSMKAWVNYIHNDCTGDLVWRTGPQLGDWVALDAYEGSYHGATPTDLIATAYFAHSTEILAKSAKVLGKEADAAHYEVMFARIKADFRQAFLPEGKLLCDTQTGYIVPLVFRLLEGAEVEIAAASLVSHLARNNDHLTTGFVGSPYLCRALSENGHMDLAVKLLLHTDFPSWLYQVEKGATTVWEHWDGIKQDGSFWSADMNSFNHYAYGSIGDWIYSTLGGIKAAAPGYKKIQIAPQIHPQFTYVNCGYESVYGRIESNWETKDGRFTLHITIPANTTATVVLPDGRTEEIGSGQYNFACEAVYR